jgi:hypothetical protein
MPTKRSKVYDTQGVIHRSRRSTCTIAPEEPPHIAQQTAPARYLDLITVAVPPALVACLAIATAAAVARLWRGGVSVSSSGHINLAGEACACACLSMMWSRFFDLQHHCAFGACQWHASPGYASQQQQAAHAGRQPAGPCF